MELFDIIVNKRLWASQYYHLNDPMEGRIVPNCKISNEYKICSLSKTASSQLMWSHYADGEYGIVFGVEIEKNEYIDNELRIKSIDYVKQVGLSNNIDSSLEALSKKHEFWSYEEEVRVFVKYHDYVPVNIKEIIFGKRLKRGSRNGNIIYDVMKKFHSIKEEYKKDDRHHFII